MATLKLLSGYQKYCSACAVNQYKISKQASYSRAIRDPDKKALMLNRSKEWLSVNPDRAKAISRKSYLKNKSRLVELRRLRGFKLSPLGRTEHCPLCGQAFKVAERAQKYCLKCGRSKNKE